MQPVPITTNIVSSNPVHVEVYSIHYYLLTFVSNLRQVGDFSDTPVSFTNKTDRHDITELLLKMALNTITLTLQTPVYGCHLLRRLFLNNCL